METDCNREYRVFFRHSLRLFVIVLLPLNSRQEGRLFRDSHKGTCTLSEFSGVIYCSLLLHCIYRNGELRQSIYCYQSVSIPLYFHFPCFWQEGGGREAQRYLSFDSALLFHFFQVGCTAMPYSTQGKQLGGDNS